MGKAGVQVQDHFPEGLRPGKAGGGAGAQRFCLDFGYKVEHQLGAAFWLDLSPYKRGSMK